MPQMMTVNRSNDISWTSSALFMPIVVEECDRMVNRAASDSTISDQLRLVVIDGKTMLVPVNDLWFYSAAWQAGEKEVDEQIRNGDVEHFITFDDFLNSLE